MPRTKEVIVLYTDDGIGNSIGEIVGEVVRCKDCKWKELCEKTLEYKGADGYCSKGEMADREMSREEAIKRLEEGAPFSELYDSRWEVALALAIKALKTEPVVRCKDCIYSGQCTKEIIMRKRIGSYLYCPLGDNGYCSQGERREDGTC